MRRLLLSAVAVLALLVSSTALAQSTIRSPGDHVNSVELEPHLVLLPWNTPNGDLGYGLGFRATVPIVDNGFVPSINNSVGIGFGLDWLHYGCGGDYGPYHYDCSFNRFMVPVVMQWNFFLSRSWSVFGEPGLAFSYVSFSCPDVYVTDIHGNRILATGDGYCNYSHTHLDGVFFAGARWHFSQYTTLTMRLGFDGFSAGWDTGYFSIGVSFL